MPVWDDCHAGFWYSRDEVRRLTSDEEEAMGTLRLPAQADVLPHIWGEVYIETGVSEGTSMAVAAAFYRPAFKELHGIECDWEMVEKARQRFAGDQRITICYGSSPLWLPDVIDPSKRTVFWLDAHYDGAKPTSFDPRHGQCVLLDELKIIMAVPWQVQPTILIDDSSTFCSDLWWERGAHGHGMDRRQNPTFQQIYDALGAVDNRYDLLIREQCIYCFPRS
jgi:hypothetical protein